MQSSLKKSLYLGLAALSFASVASVTANSSNANAAKKHRAAKKVTYKTTDRNLDQSVVFTSTGKSAVYSKPGTVKGARVVATKADMGSKANSKSTGDQFMAYQSAVTSKGVHYYKVVSFDKKVRGYVYVGGVNKVAGKTSTATPSNTNGYLKSNRLFNVAYGSQFGAKLKNFNGINFSTDKFTVNDAVSVRNGAKYYNVTDNNNAMINGWVNADYFTNDTPQAVNDAKNDAKAVKVTFYNTNGKGVVLSTKSIQPNGGFYDRAGGFNNDSYSKDQVIDAIKSSLVNSGETFAGNYTNVNTGRSNDVVRQGDSLNVSVKDSDNQTAQFKAFGLTPQPDGSVTSSQLSNSNFAGITDGQRRELTEAENNTIPFDQFVNDFFDNGKVWNVVKDNNGSTYTFDKTRTMNAFNKTVNDFKNNSNYYTSGNSNYSREFTFADAFVNNQLPVYYTKDNTAKAVSYGINNNFNTNAVIAGQSAAKPATVTPQNLVDNTLGDANAANTKYGTNATDFANNLVKNASDKSFNSLYNAFNDKSVAVSANNKDAYNKVQSVINTKKPLVDQSDAAASVKSVLNKDFTGVKLEGTAVGQLAGKSTLKDVLDASYDKNNIAKAFSASMTGQGKHKENVQKALVAALQLDGNTADSASESNTVASGATNVNTQQYFGLNDNEAVALLNALK